MENTVQIGDVVRLKSGGIKFTVMSVEAHLIECAYWNESISKISYTGNQDYGLFIKIE